VTGAHITLLVEDFQGLVRATDPEQRYPALEQILVKGRSRQIESITANHLRLSLFGMDHRTSLPVAALSQLGEDSIGQPDIDYWLRADPVTMRADMAQVFLTSYGFADLDTDEQNAIVECVHQVLEAEGLKAGFSPLGYWSITLNEPLDFQFTALDQALGMDVAEALPGHAGARNWRRILNEIQIALHNCPVNIRRRNSGWQEVNSVWFWGGGYLPRPSQHNQVDVVYSSHPVTRGLAILHQCRLNTLEQAAPGRWAKGGHHWLVDWQPESRSAHLELDRLEQVVQGLQVEVQTAGSSLTLFDGRGRGWHFDRRTRLRFWKRTVPLTSALARS